MARWCTLTSLLLMSLGLPGTVSAQTYEQQGSGVTPAGWSDAGYGVTKTKGKVRSTGPMGPLPAGPGRTIYEELPDDRGFLYPDTPFERMLKDTFRHAYFRTDYLLWNISNPGSQLIGGGTAIIGLDDINRGHPAGDPYWNNPATNPFAYPNQAQDPYLFQPYIDPLTAFQVSNPATGNTSLIAVVQPTLAGVDINNNNGIRGTFGLPVSDIGTFEASIFSMQTSFNPITRAPVRQFNVFDSNGNGIPGEIFTPLAVGEFGRDGGSINDVIDDFQAFAIPILVDGAIPQPGVQRTGVDPVVLTMPPITNPLSPGTELNPETADPNDTRVIPGRGDNFRIVWDLGYRASLRTRMWGTEGNFLFAPLDANSPLVLQPFAGFRYLRFAEEFDQHGGYRYLPTGETVAIPVSRRIDASTVNNVYGPQIGLRSELTSRWFTLGAQPKVMLGMNSYDANLETENVLAPVGLPNVNTIEVNQSIGANKTTFGVIGDLEVYSKLHVTEHLTLQVGYNLMWVGNLTRPYSNIVYNAKTVQTQNPDGTVTNQLQSDFKQDVNYTGVMIQGLNLGGELRY